MAVNPKLILLAAETLSSEEGRNRVLQIVLYALGVVLMIVVMFAGLISGLLGVIQNSNLQRHWNYVRSSITELFDGMENDINTDVKNEVYDFMPEFSINLSKVTIGNKFDGNSLILYDEEEIAAAEYVMLQFARQLRSITNETDFNAFMADYPDDTLEYTDIIKIQFTDVRLIFYTGKRYEDDELLNTLVQHGHHNIVALYTGVSDKKCIEQMYEDLISCFTEDGLPTKVWRRFDKSYDAAAEMRREAQRAERELNRKCFANTELKVAVVGTQARIGSTSFAVHLAHYFAKHGGKPIVIGMQKEKAVQLDMLKDFYDGSCKNGIYSVGAVNFCTIGTDMRNYPIKIFDYGNIPSEQMQLYGFEKVYLVGGLSWNELAPFYQRQADMNDTNYTVVVNFSDDEHIERFRDMLSVNESEIICAPLESDTFSSDSYEHIFAKAFAEWQTEAENEQEI